MIRDPMNLETRGVPLSEILSPLRRAFLSAKADAHRAAVKLTANAADLGFFLGLAIVAAGIALIYLPAGLIALGASLSACIYLDQRSRR